MKSGKNICDFSYKRIKLRIICINNKLVRIQYIDKLIYKNKSKCVLEVKKQLKEYFDKKRTKFNIDIYLEGTDFQKRVWKELNKVSYGKIVSYKYIAQKIGNSLSYRAVGNACNKNPIPIIIPCHRIINNNGNIGNYASGKKIKLFLLNIENSINYVDPTKKCHIYPIKK